MSKYSHQKIEQKWQEIWEKEKVFLSDESANTDKKNYILDMFPYPSAAGLHVGHPEGYTATDIYSRYLIMKGENVLHPMGWDAFGLPAENFAIKSGGHPKTITQENIKNFKRQIKALGFSYDWSREVNTSDPAYYKWTQWLFLLFYKNDLAYKRKAPVNWCDSCQTVLANEQVVDGKCERCGHQVVQKNLEQWFFKITGGDPKNKNDAYPERLLDNLEKLDWPEPIKAMQQNWIGKSEGAEIGFNLSNNNGQIKVFTTRPDTLYGATYLVLAPEHEIIDSVKNSIENWDDVEKYIENSKSKSQLERTDLAKEKTGVKLEGVKVINPASGEKISVWVGDYVLTGYGTGAIMAVPAHDDRDWEFAKKYDLPIKQVVAKETGVKRNNELIKSVYVGNGILINSKEFDSSESEEAKWKITKKVGGRRVTQYKLRDWLISRQRYWGAPIPIIYCPKCGQLPVPEKDLPIELPEDVDFRPTGESPLARSESFQNVKCHKCASAAKRESDTMDTFVDSSWYFLRYADSNNKEAFADKEKLKKWLPVDTYVGGAEHAVLHLMYARFFCMALHDLGYLDFEEPFIKLRNQGMILGSDGQKMSKSRGNVINPDEVIENLGADTMRVYEMFMGPLADAKPWDTNGIIGVRRFLDRVWVMQEKTVEKYSNQKNENDLTKEINKTIKKVGNDIVGFSFNTAVSQLMIFVNLVYKTGEISKNHFELFLKVLSPLAPHISEEIWSLLGNKEILAKQNWPEFDDSLLIESESNFVIQINGKFKFNILASAEITEKELIALAKKEEKIVKNLEDKKILKTVFIKGRLLNFVIEDN